MATVAGIRFKKAGKVYYFDPTGVWPNPGDPVIVETVRGIEMGETVTGAREVKDEMLIAPLKKIIRIATPEDVSRAAECASREGDALEICARKVAAHKLDMKLVDAEYTFDGSKLIFYFTANGRVDFRDLVKDLASVFKMRIELRQIGVRDEAKMLGGLGACGRPICCGTFLNDFQPVSIRMAKDQSLSLNPTKISGQCGRLMCCLKYEQENYESILKKLPRVGREIMTPDGVGTVTEIAVIREKIKVRLHEPDDTYDVREYGIEEVCRPGETLPVREEPEETDEAEEMEDFFSAESEEAHPARPRPERNRERPADRPAPDKPKADEQPQKRRYPRPKGKKQTTEQYFSRENTGESAASDAQPEEDGEMQE
ncbi:MAG: stage 0 sporulation family protein [Clostridia bacterium]|nr:stage 0 sporulation family protein [Clostridia bacterium]